MYYSVGLEGMPSPDTEQTMAEYARAVLHDRAKDLISQFRTEADQLTARTREQMETLVTDIEEALAQGAAVEEVREILQSKGRHVGDPRRRLALFKWSSACSIAVDVLQERTDGIQAASTPPLAHNCRESA